MDTFDQGYIAGILDGEGTIFFRERYGLRISVPNTDESLLAYLQDRMGGSILSAAKACPPECPDDHVHRSRDGWIWEASGERAAIVLRCLASRMPVKGSRAIEALSRHDGRPNRKVLANEKVTFDMHERGWPVMLPKTHGELRHYRAGCRCSQCRAANASYARALRGQA
jgi:hypothetical protein